MLGLISDTKREVDLDVQLKASGIAKEELKQLDEVRT